MTRWTGYDTATGGVTYTVPEPTAELVVLGGKEYPATVKAVRVDGGALQIVVSVTPGSDRKAMALLRRLTRRS